MRELLYQKCVSKLHNEFVATPVTTGAWVALDTSFDEACVACEILNTSSAVLQLSTGDLGDEDNHILKYFVLPGKSGQIPLEVARGKRFSAKAIGTVDADDGDLYMNFFG